jgi:hypothetical protein
MRLETPEIRCPFILSTAACGDIPARRAGRGRTGRIKLLPKPVVIALDMDRAFDDILHAALALDHDSKVELLGRLRMAIIADALLVNEEHSQSSKACYPLEEEVYEKSLQNPLQFNPSQNPSA